MSVLALQPGERCGRNTLDKLFGERDLIKKNVIVPILLIKAVFYLVE